jgi:DNA-binding response OmpR family regulator
MKKHILLVEDNERLRSNLLFVLNKEGFDAVGAINGTQALQVIANEIPDLIISDIMMPDMDGYDLVKHLRESPDTVDLPVIFLTAKATTEELRSGMRHGVNEYLTKPVNINDLIATIHVRLEYAQKQKKKWIANLHLLQIHLTSILPHELRTPLSGILGASSLLRTNIEQLTRDDLLEMYGCIETSARRLERIAENFLLYVQLQVLLEEQRSIPKEIQEKKPQYQFVSVKEHLEEIIHHCAQRYNRLTDVHCFLHDGSVQCSVGHFTKVIFEVMDNALQFSPKDTPIEIISDQDDEKYTITITDFGRGMTDEQLKAIQNFPSVFKQFDRKKFEQQGVGMGLVLVYNILQLYRGELSITSQYGHSTTAHLTFRT